MANKFTAPLSHHTANSMSLMLVVGGALLVVLAGVFMVIGALVGVMMHSAGGVSAAAGALFAPAHVLLLLILIVLLIVLWHHLRGGQTATAAAAPSVSPQFAEALNATAKALRGNSEALGMMQGDAGKIGAVQADLRRAAEALERLAKGA